MQHPFDGIQQARTESLASRRTLLGGFLATLAWLIGGRAVAQPRPNATTQRAGEEGARRPPPSQPLPPNRRPPVRPPVVQPPIDRSLLTMAWWEDGRRRFPPVQTTGALGEEGGATTFALGEEGSVTTFALYEEGAVTTFALYEEGGLPTLPYDGPLTMAMWEVGEVPPWLR